LRVALIIIQLLYKCASKSTCK